MDKTTSGPYEDFAGIYRDLGFWPRPLVYPGMDKNSGKPLGKACKEPGWQKPDHELPEGTIEQWRDKYGHYNIGILAGSPFEDGTLLGAVDVDHDQYLRLSKILLGTPPCMRIGKKGAVIPVRYEPQLDNAKFRVKGKNPEFGQVVELLFKKQQFAIPPSIHPETGKAYRWEGIPLHEIDYRKLPLIGE